MRSTYCCVGRMSTEDGLRSVHEAMQGTTYQFVCYSQGAGWSALARKLATNGTLTSCAVGSGSFALSSTRLQMGLQLSYPYYRTGLGVLIATGSKQIDMFAFIKPFTIEVWLAFLATILLVPLLAWLVEQLMEEGVVLVDWDSLYEARQATYSSILAVFNLTVYKVKSFAAQVLIITFCFVNLIVMATYVANLAAALTNISMSKGFEDIADLRGRRVAAHSTYQPIITSSYGVLPKALDFDGPPTFDELRTALTNRSLDAYVMDLPEIGYWTVARNDDCAVRLLPRAYALIDFGYLFHRDFDPASFAAFNAALFSALEANHVEQLAAKFLLFLGALDKCAAASASGAVTFHQVRRH
ncbi:hypothetical protein PLESTM_001639200 [Pleodorina starrii]|nr:hypothetical protein PLESTM_001639200 [Pleodorina starrii]